ncbi:MAG: hypothetical protein KKC28_12155 [Verrucomicrobia bacterium]|nr:hypothetical protein [Verrucomicrobiota bacterium]MBU1857724.1 hypothetical protein [Verrucomicrobiota bacterium]
MATIEQASQTAVEFLKRTLQVGEVKILGAVKSDDGWAIEAEVFEPSSFIKALGLQTRVQDRNLYTMKLNGRLEVEAYERKIT